MSIVLASNNEHKFIEFKEIFSDLNTEIIMQKDCGCNFSVDETGSTFAENAYLKAIAVTEHTGLAAISDDSGLCVDYLNGQPGILSARFGGGIARNDIERCFYLLMLMKNAYDRSARFVCSICCTFPNGDVIRAEGTCQGIILREPCGSNGFGYDPIFKPDGFSCSMAELSSTEKNAISHRGKALKAFYDKYQRYINDKY